MPKHDLLPRGVEGTEACLLYRDTTDPFGFGLAPEQDHLLTGPHPEDASVGETMNVWIYDGPRNTGINIHGRMQNGEMIAPVTIFLPDGRVLRIRTDTPATFTDPARPHTERIHYHCEQPFRRWTYAGDDVPVWVTSEAALAAGAIADETPTTTVSFEFHATTLSPAWIQGTLLTEAYQASQGEAGLWIATRSPKGLSSNTFRFEQAIMAEGTIRFEGQDYPVKGYGLRGHVRGTRIMSGMDGHTWLCGATEAGTAFGVLSMPRAEGGFHFSESYVFKDGTLYPTRIRHAPVMSYDPAEPGYVIELVSDQLGLVRITGRDDRLFWWSMPEWGSAQPPRWGIDPNASMVMRQALASFEIDGLPAWGMNERSGLRV